MVARAAELLAEYLESRQAEVCELILQALTPRYAERIRPFVQEWLKSQFDIIHGRSDRTNEWVALLTEEIRAVGGGVDDTLEQVRIFRDVFIQFFSGNVAGVDDAALYRHVLDVTDRYFKHITSYAAQLTRETLMAERRRQRTMVESLDTPFLTLNTDGIIDLVNSGFAKQIGIPQDHLPGRELAWHCDQDTANEIQRILRQKRSMGARVFEGHLLTAKGEKVPSLFSVQPMFDSLGRRDGSAVSVTPMVDDPRLSSGELLRYFAENILSVIPLPVQVMDRSRNIVYQNPACQNLHLTCGEEALPYCCRLTAVRSRTAPCVCEKAFTTGEMGEYEFFCEEDTGGGRWFSVYLLPLREPGGKIVQVACGLRDITKRRELRKSLEKQILEQQHSSVVSQVAVSVAHQLRNPLGVMIGFAEMMAQGLPQDEMGNALDKMLRNGLRCKEIVENLLEFGQGFPDERVPSDLLTLIDELVKPMLPGSKCNRVVWRAPDGPVYVECVPHQLAQVIVNLLDNALRVATQVICEVREEQEKIYLSVCDDGPGVPEKLRERIFQPFFTTQKKEGAVGLGLSLSQAVIREYGGDLLLEDTPGISESGARFTLHLPIATPDEKILVAPAPPRKKNRSARYILVVDDELDLLEMLAMILELRGYIVDTTGTGAEAIELLKRNAYDAAVLDVQLPGDLGGPQLYEYISKTKPLLAKHVLFITADTMNYATRRFLDSAQCPSMEKPFLVYDFVAQVGQLFDSEKSAPTENT